MNFNLFCHGAVLAVALTASACNRVAERPAMTADDIRIGRQAMSISEVSLLARNGYQREALADLKRRHITAEISAEEELQLRGYAGPELLAALKDPQNILTPNQKDAYDEAQSTAITQKARVAHARNLQDNGQNRQALLSPSAEQQEIDRRQQLQNESFRLSEARQANKRRANAPNSAASTRAGIPLKTPMPAIGPTAHRRRSEVPGRLRQTGLTIAN